MKTSGIKSSVAAGVLALSCTAHAIPIDKTITLTDSQIPAVSGRTINFLFSGLNPNASSDAIVTFRVKGDLNVSSENITITADSGTYDFGRWLDDVISNDIITGPSNDHGNEYGSIVSGVASIPLATLSTLLTDQQLQFTWQYTSAANDFGSDFAEVRIQYEAGGAIPEPTTLALMGLGLAGIGFARKKKLA